MSDRIEDLEAKNALAALEAAEKAGCAALRAQGGDERSIAAETGFLMNMDRVRQALTSSETVPDAVRQLPEKWFRRADDNALPYSDARREQLRTDAGELRHEIHKALSAAPASEAVPDKLLAALLFRRDQPMTPHHVGALRERLGHPTDNDLLEIIRTGKRPSSQHEQGE